MTDRIEAMRAYIENTNIPKQTRDRYYTTVTETQAIYQRFRVDPYEAICIAFEYGMCKGWRAAKAGTRKQTSMEAKP